MKRRTTTTSMTTKRNLLPRKRRRRKKRLWWLTLPTTMSPPSWPKFTPGFSVFSAFAVKNLKKSFLSFFSAYLESKRSDER